MGLQTCPPVMLERRLKQLIKIPFFTFRDLSSLQKVVYTYTHKNRTINSVSAQTGILFIYRIIFNFLNRSFSFKMHKEYHTSFNI